MPGGSLKQVDFTLYGSFAKTYRGHGTDRALLGGIMGFHTDDKRIPDSFSIAADRGLYIPSPQTRQKQRSIPIPSTSA